MRNYKILLLSILNLLLFSYIVSANSAAPPSLIIICNAPPDTVISSFSNGQMHEGRHIQFNGVNYYTFPETDGKALFIEHKGGSFSVRLPEDLLVGYEPTIFFDFNTRTFSPGEFVTRSLTFVPLRVISTLIIEGFLFMLFGFKEKRSWYVFFITNILTQAALNLAILKNIDPVWHYSFILLGIYELLIIITEYAVYKKFIREKKLILLYTVFSNLASWYIGGRILASIPL